MVSESFEANIDMSDDKTIHYLRRSRRARAIMQAGALAVALAGLIAVFGTPISPASVPQPFARLVADSSLILGASGLFIIVFAGRQLRSNQRAIERGPFIESQRRGPIRSLRWWMVLLAIAGVVAATWVTSVWLLHEADSASDRATARIDAIKTSMTVGAGVAAGLALALTARRQWLAERAQGHTEDDAADRRVTELYTMAVEQLGSHNATVRVGGLYALERLAQDNRGHRQTIAEVICGYLRINETLAGQQSTPLRTDEVLPGDCPSDPTGPSGRSATPRDVAELQVRQTAQRILTTHLQPDRSWHGTPSNPKFWSDIDLDLSGASLIDLDLHNCQVANANFQLATFSNSVNFTGTQFQRRANFTGAELIGDADFSLAEFHWHANFELARFRGSADFGWVEFSGRAEFENAEFSGAAKFDRAQFSRTAKFDHVTFAADADFSQAQFSESASFTGSAFVGDTVFTGSQLVRLDNGSGPNFRYSTFEAGVQLDDSRTSNVTNIRHAPAWVHTCLHGAMARVDVSDADERVWFPGWDSNGTDVPRSDDLPGTWSYLRSSYPDSPINKPRSS